MPRGTWNKQQVSFDPSKCGTPKGRDQHRRRLESPCEPCRLAWNDVCRQRQAVMRESGWVRPERRGPKKTCHDCGEVLKTGGRAAEKPRCTSCWRTYRDALAKARAKRRRLEEKLRRSSQGTIGKRVWVTGECAQCLLHFTRIRQASPYCSKACSKRARSTKRHFKVSTRARVEIYERDGWICQLCLEPVDRDLMWTDPRSNWSPSLDHIEPQSWALIPDHSPANLRLAHRWCNSVRGDLSRYTDEDLRVA